MNPVVTTERSPEKQRCALDAKGKWRRNWTAARRPFMNRVRAPDKEWWCGVRNQLHLKWRCHDELPACCEVVGLLRRHQDMLGGVVRFFRTCRRIGRSLYLCFFEGQVDHQVAGNHERGRQGHPGDDRNGPRDLFHAQHGPTIWLSRRPVNAPGGICLGITPAPTVVGERHILTKGCAAGRFGLCRPTLNKPSRLMLRPLLKW